MSFLFRLFLEQIKKHPNINDVPAKMKEENYAMLKDVMQKAEALKLKLKTKYTREYVSHS